ncbi:MAG: hypothetical protein ABSF96_09825 [Steroidobacteraceae bacterium]|jgi:uncharacterized membrane protein
MEPQLRVALPVERALIDYTQWVYALQALSVLIGLFTSRAVAVRFAFGLPSLVALVMSYARRAQARDSWLEAHFRWQIRTFWFTWLWLLVLWAIAFPLMLIGIGFIIAMLGMAVIGLWVIYRVARGWLALREGRAVPQPR